MALGTAGVNNTDSLAAPSAPRLTPLWALKFVYCTGSGSSACIFKFITVYYHNIGLRNSQIGIVQMINPYSTFVAQLAWAALCDRLGSFKEVLIISNGIGVAAMCCLLLQPVQVCFPLLCCVVLLTSGFMSSRGSVNDSMVLQVTKDYAEARKQEEEQGQVSSICKIPSYGEQRLWSSVGWGGCSLLGGYMMDACGIPFIFLSGGFLLACTVAVIAFFYPGQFVRRRAGQQAQTDNDVAQRAQSFRSFTVLWFFANMFIYGMFMSLVETYLFVFLLTDFDPPASRLLLGSTVTVMCFFEIPVFFYVDRLFDKFSLTTLLSCCHFVFAARCAIYVILPRSHAVTVLLTEPLHGFTFAMMWSCAVQYGKQVAPVGSEAKMQALINGVYYQLGIGCGSLVWGFVTEPGHLGLRVSYLLAAGLIVLWSFIWNLGWKLHKCYDSSRSQPAHYAREARFSNSFSGM